MRNASPAEALVPRPWPFLNTLAPSWIPLGTRKGGNLAQPLVTKAISALKNLAVGFAACAQPPPGEPIPGLASMMAFAEHPELPAKSSTVFAAESICAVTAPPAVDMPNTAAPQAGLARQKPATIPMAIPPIIFILFAFQMLLRPNMAFLSGHRSRLSFFCSSVLASFRLVAARPAFVLEVRIIFHAGDTEGRFFPGV